MWFVYSSFSLQPTKKKSTITKLEQNRALGDSIQTMSSVGRFILIARLQPPIIFTVLFILIYTFFIYPFLPESIPTDVDFDLQHLIYVFVAVFIFGFVSEACRFHSAVGGFMLGVLIPDGNFKKFVVARVEGLVSEPTTRCSTKVGLSTSLYSFSFFLALN